MIVLFIDEDPPDEFFDITEADLRKMMTDIQQKV